MAENRPHERPVAKGASRGKGRIPWQRTVPTSVTTTILVMVVIGLSTFLVINRKPSSPKSSVSQKNVQANKSTGDSEKAKTTETKKAEPESIRIEVHWDGPSVNGSSMGIEATLSNPEDSGDYDHYVSSTGASGSLTLILDDMDHDYNFSATVSNEPDFPGYILDSNIYAEVYIGDETKPVTYSMKSDYSDIWKSYTGVKLWGPFGISRGKLVNYDSSWMDVSWDTDEEDDDLPDWVLENTVPIPDDDLYYFGSLIGTVDYSYTPCIEEVDAVNGYFILSGVLSASTVDTGNFSDGEDIGYCSYRIPIANDAEFYAGGGNGGSKSMTLEEFVELAQYYSGLGLIIYVEDGYLVGGWISS